MKVFKEKSTDYFTGEIWERSKFAYNCGFLGLKCSNFHASLREQRGLENETWYKILFHSHCLKFYNSRFLKFSLQLFN